MGSKEIGPAAIAGAVVLVAALIFGIYRLTFHDTPKVSEDKIPAYARARMGQGAPAGHAPAAGASAPYNAAAHPGSMQGH
jgi:hypothetical protein